MGSLELDGAPGEKPLVLLEQMGPLKQESRYLLVTMGPLVLAGPLK